MRTGQIVLRDGKRSCQIVLRDGMRTGQMVLRDGKRSCQIVLRDGMRTGQMSSGTARGQCRLTSETLRGQGKWSSGTADLTAPALPGTSFCCPQLSGNRDDVTTPTGTSVQPLPNQRPPFFILKSSTVSCRGRVLAIHMQRSCSLSSIMMPCPLHLQLALSAF
jgi:CubicO group peptidase (beta-lactamase class C family)